MAHGDWIKFETPEGKPLLVNVASGASIEPDRGAPARPNSVDPASPIPAVPPQEGVCLLRLPDGMGGRRIRGDVDDLALALGALTLTR